MKICSLYGAGFYYIPGTDTCLKVGGWVRAETNWNSDASFSPFRSATLDSRALNQERTRARGILTLDARAQTAYGTLRSYIAGGFQSTDAGRGEIYAPRAFIQWAGFTAGLAQSFFDFYVTPAYSNTTNVWSSDTGGGGDHVFAYTAQFGNGLSASVSLEDTSTRRTTITNDAYAGRQWYDVVGNIRMDQAWGSAQVMGGAHQLRTFSGVPSDEIGWAVGGGVTVKLPMLGKGDSISTQLTYGKGAMRYVGSTLGTGFAIADGGTLAFGPVTDSVVAAGSQELTTGWSVVAGFQHSWNPNWKTSLYGTYGAISYTDAAKAAAAVDDWSMWQVGSRTVWTPVPNLDLSVDVMYNHINTAFDSVAGFDDKGWWQGIFRVQRNFYP